MNMKLEILHLLVMILALWLLFTAMWNYKEHNGDRQIIEVLWQIEENTREINIEVLFDNE